jgi:hypothetical protein
MAAAVLHLVVVFAVAPVLPEDDAFITLRYASNLIQGNGFVFNPGERVLGTTSPAHALLLATLGGLIGVERLVTAAVAMNAAWILLTAAAAFLLLRGLGLRTPIPELAAVWLLLCPQMLEMGLGGMESCLFAFVAVATLALAVHHWWACSAVLGVLTFLVRPEGALVLMVVGLIWWRSGRPRARVVAALTASLLGTWAIAGGLYFGSPIPQSVLAKVQASGSVATGSTATRLAAEAVAWLFGGRVNAAAVVFGPREVLVAVLTVLLGAAAISAVKRGHVRTEGLWLPVWLGLITAIYALANPFWFPWYAMMVLIPWWLSFVVGIGGCEAELQRLTPRWSWAPPAVMAILVATQIAGAAAVMLLPNWPATAYGVSTPYRARILSYAEAARWLNENATEGSAVLSSEIGMLGYRYHRGPIVDAWGLVTPDVAGAGASHRPGSIESGLVQARRPSFVVVLPKFVDRLSASPWFAANYRFVRTFGVPGRNYPRYRLALFARRDLEGPR